MADGRVGLGEALCESRCDFVYVSRVREGAADGCCWGRGGRAAAPCPKLTSPFSPSVYIWPWLYNRSPSCKSQPGTDLSFMKDLPMVHLKVRRPAERCLALESQGLFA